MLAGGGRTGGGQGGGGQGGGGQGGGGQGVGGQGGGGQGGGGQSGGGGHVGQFCSAWNGGDCRFGQNCKFFTNAPASHQVGPSAVRTIGLRTIDEPGTSSPCYFEYSGQ